jgi:hypothetical protein
MTICTLCGNNVTGKKFCPDCGTSVQPVVAGTQVTGGQVCPQCHGEVKPGAAFCMHCGSALNLATPPPPPVVRVCPACHMQVSSDSAFCTSCGHDMRQLLSQAQPAPSMSYIHCSQCGYQNVSGQRFCSGCGRQLVAGTPAATGYAPQPAPYQQPASYQQQPTPYQQQYPQQSAPYQQQPNYPQPYGQPQYGQAGYQVQPMLGQQPMVLRCPTCMAMAPLGSTNCVSCRTNLAGIVPTPANMPVQGQQGGFLQGNGGNNMIVGALGGAAAVIGGEMLLHGLENQVENRVEDNMGFGGQRHRRSEGPLGGLRELADDVGLI